MVEESLRAIFEAEKKATEQLEAAKRQGLALVEAARKQAEKIKADARLATKAKSQKLLEDSRKKAEAEVTELLVEARKQSLAMERRAKARSAEAIQLVLDVILR